MRRVSFIILGVLALSACGPGSDDILFDGQYFNTKLKSERDNRASFSVTASPVSASLDGVREAARYEATVYCVNRYGSSDVAWVVGPDAAAEDLPLDGDTLILQGRCRE